MRKLIVSSSTNDYLITDCGEVVSVRKSSGKETVRKTSPMNTGYLAVNLPTPDGSTRRSRLVHHMVLEAFVGPRPEGMVACHKDGNVLNNHVSNLRWDTQSANLLDRVRHGTSTRKFTDEQVTEIRRLVSGGVSDRKVAKRFGVARNTIRGIISGNTYRTGGY